MNKSEKLRVDYSPKPVQIDGEAQNPGPRACRRGFRSEEARGWRVRRNAVQALLREARIVLENVQVVVNDATSLLKEVQEERGHTDEDATVVPISDSSLSFNVSKQNKTTNQMNAFEFFHCNLDGFPINSAKVVTAIRLRPTVPHVVFLNETQTDAGDKVFNL